MNRQKKANVIEQLRHNLENNQAVFVVGYQGLTVPLMQSLRNELRKHNSSFRVAKARLMKRAAEGLTGPDQLESYFKNQVGLVFAGKNSPAVAKVLHKFAKENAALQLIVGCLDRELLDRGSVVRIASLPSKEVLLAIVCGTINAPLVGLVRVLDQLKARLVSDSEQISESK